MSSTEEMMSKQHACNCSSKQRGVQGNWCNSKILNHRLLYYMCLLKTPVSKLMIYDDFMNHKQF